VRVILAVGAPIQPVEAVRVLEVDYFPAIVATTEAVAVILGSKAD
jgi:hypothetical protein